MIASFITAQILIILSFVIYRLFFASSNQYHIRRRFLIIASCISLALPLGLAGINYAQEHQAQQNLAAEAFCPSEEVLEACFTTAVCDKNFCHCERVTRANILVYQSNFLYDFILAQKNEVSTTYLIVCTLFALGFVLQIVFLILLILNSSKQEVALNGVKYWKLLPTGNFSVGSFNLFGKYVIWPKHFNLLHQDEQEIVLHHELKHIQQKDTFVKIIFNLFWVVWLLNPVYYLIRRELHLVNEFLCDKAAIEFGKITKKEYANLLLQVAAPNRNYIVSGLGSSHLNLRIQELFRAGKDVGLRNIRFGWSLLLFVIIAAAQPSFSLMNQQETKVEIYQSLSDMYQQEGKSVFCKQCLLERLEAQ